MSMETILIVQIDPANEHNIDENFMLLLRCNSATLLLKDNPLRTYLTSQQLAGKWDCVVAVKRLPALHYSVDFISWFVGIMDSIVEL